MLFAQVDRVCLSPSKITAIDCDDENDNRAEYSKLDAGAQRVAFLARAKHFFKPGDARLTQSASITVFACLAVPLCVVKARCCRITAWTFLNIRDQIPTWTGGLFGARQNSEVWLYFHPINTSHFTAVVAPAFVGFRIAGATRFIRVQDDGVPVPFDSRKSWVNFQIAMGDITTAVDAIVFRATLASPSPAFFVSKIL